MLTHAAVFACIAIAIASALFDLVSRRIPNLLTIGGLLLGVCLHAVVSGGRGALFSLAGAIVCAVIPMMGFMRGEMGGGDVKLFAAIGALVGPSLGLDAEAFTFVVVLVVLWPWRLARAGVLRHVLAGAYARTRSLLCRSAVVVAPAPHAPTAVAPVILGPSILLGLTLAIVRHGGLS